MPTPDPGSTTNQLGTEGLDALPPADQTALVSTLTNLFLGFRNRDTDPLADVYSPDADWVNAFGSVKKGSAEIIDYLRGLFGDVNFNDGKLVGAPKPRCASSPQTSLSYPHVCKSADRASLVEAASPCATTDPCTCCTSNPTGTGPRYQRSTWTLARTRATQVIPECK